MNGYDRIRRQGEIAFAGEGGGAMGAARPY